ncbi:hypothetical protein BJX70DRAFT_367310 [Aspergillus crustosus]
MRHQGVQSLFSVAVLALSFGQLPQVSAEEEYLPYQCNGNAEGVDEYGSAQHPISDCIVAGWLVFDDFHKPGTGDVINLPEI